MFNKFKKILQFSFIFLIFVNIFTFNRTEAFDYKTFYLGILFFWIFLIWGLGLLKGLFFFKKAPVYLLVLFFLLINLLSLFFSPYKFVGVIQFYQVFLYIGLFFAFITTFEDLNDISWFIKILSFSIFLVSIYAIAQYAGKDFLRLSHKGIVFSTFINKNFLGGVLAINLPFSLGSLFLENRIFKRIFYLLASLATIYALILTGSKGGILVGFWGLIFFFSFFILLNNSRSYRQKIITLFLVSLIILVIISGLGIYLKNYNIILASFKERISLWKISLKMIKEHPFRGVGIGNFVLFAYQYKKPYFHPEQFIRHAWNEFLELWAELGFLGFSIFFVLLIWISLHGIRIISHSGKDKPNKLISLSCLSSLFAGILLNLGEINLRIIYLGIYFWICLAILSKMIEINVINTTFNIPRLYRKFIFFLIVFLNFSFFGFTFFPIIMYKIHISKPSLPTIDFEDLEKEIKNLEENSHYDRSSLYNNLANLYLLKGDIEKAEENYLKVLNINPLSPSANYNLGYLYFLKGEIKKAYERLVFCLRLNPFDTDAYFMLRKNILY